VLPDDGESEVDYAEIAARTGEDEASLRVTAHRMRKRYRHLLREEIKRTLADDAMVDEEMAALLGAFS
jgi:RNA polymerase sigma-70 factor (ECF subfamily)